MLRDSEFGPIRVRAFGTYTVKVSDPARFMSEIVGADCEVTMDEIGPQLRNIIVQAFSHVNAASGIPVLDMAARLTGVGGLIVGPARCLDRAHRCHALHTVAAGAVCYAVALGKGRIVPPVCA
jgi:membrane protease subunit (stomatin/prohibitin family)